MVGYLFMNPYVHSARPPDWISVSWYPNPSLAIPSAAHVIYEIHIRYIATTRNATMAIDSFLDKPNSLEIVSRLNIQAARILLNCVGEHAYFIAILSLTIYAVASSLAASSVRFSLFNLINGTSRSPLPRVYISDSNFLDRWFDPFRFLQYSRKAVFKGYKMVLFS